MRNNKITLSFLFFILININLTSCAINVNDELMKARTAYSAEEYGTAMKIWKELSEQEIPEALWGIGVLYEAGNGVKQNYNTATEWFTKASEHNYAPAQHSLGLIYYFGNDVKANKPKAIEYYTKAANQRHAPAMYLLGLEYEYGDTIKKDLPKAKSLFKKSLELGYKDSARALMRIETLDIQKNLDKIANEK